VRRAVDVALTDEPDLLDALREFPVEERGVLNRSKLGWMLKRNANRIIDGLEFRKAEADGRTAWQVVSSAAPHSPLSPAFDASSAKTSADVTAARKWDEEIVGF